MKGEFAAGQKLGEKQLADRLDVSRTPIRLALAELAKEGLLEYNSNRGFVVRRFSIDQIIDAIEVREQLEGAAAGQAARIGLSEDHRRALEACLLEVDGLLLKEEIDHSDALMWSDLNGVFHDTIVRAAGNSVLTEFVGRLASTPLASAQSFAGTYDRLDGQLAAIRRAQIRHRWVFDAIMARDPQRAELMMRQHVYEGRVNLRALLERLKGDNETQRVPMLSLVN